MEEKKVKEVGCSEVASMEYDKDELMKLEVGVNYPGSFRINPNGTIKVRAYKVGSKPTNLKKVFDADNYSILASKKIVRLVFTFDRCEQEQLAAKFKGALLECYQTLKELRIDN